MHVGRPAAAAMAIAAADGGPGYGPAPAHDPMGTVIDELIPMCQRTGCDAGRRVTARWHSMGGYGALLLAEKYPRLISAVAAIGPAVWTSYAQARAVNPGAYASAAAFADADAVTHAAALAGTAVRVACGLSDPFYPGARALARVLPPGAVTDLSKGCHTGQFFAAQEPVVPGLPRPPPDPVRGRLMPDESFTEVPGERVALRRLGWADLDQFVAYRSDEQVARYQSWDAPYPREEGERLSGR